MAGADPGGPWRLVNMTKLSGGRMRDQGWGVERWICWKRISPALGERGIRATVSFQAWHDEDELAGMSPDGVRSVSLRLGEGELLGYLLCCDEIYTRAASLEVRYVRKCGF